MYIDCTPIFVCTVVYKDIEGGKSYFLVLLKYWKIEQGRQRFNFKNIDNLKSFSTLFSKNIFFVALLFYKCTFFSLSR